MNKMLSNVEPFHIKDFKGPWHQQKDQDAPLLNANNELIAAAHGDDMTYLTIEEEYEQLIFNAPNMYKVMCGLYMNIIQISIGKPAVGLEGNIAEASRIINAVQKV